MSIAETRVLRLAFILATVNNKKITKTKASFLANSWDIY